MIFLLLSLIGGLLFLGMIFGPWIAFGRISRLTLRVDQLEQKVRLLSGPLAAQQTAQTVPEADPLAEAFSGSPQADQPEMQIQEEPPQLSQPEEAKAPLPEAAPQPTKPRRSFEQQFGARLPVWVGGIALVFAAFYLVRYSLEMGLLGPAARITLGFLFGAGLIGSAQKLGPQNARVGQSLAGAGIAVLYLCFFGARTMDLLPSALVFMGMVGTTVLAVVMALRHGAPIALMGMVGGFLTPLVMQGGGSLPLLLTYLFVLFAGFLWLVRRQNWWALSLVLLPLTFFWAVGVFFFNSTPDDMAALGLFLLGVSFLTLLATRALAQDTTPSLFGLTRAQLHKTLNIGGLGIASLLLGSAVAASGFGLDTRALLWVLALGTLALAAFDKATYAYAPWLSLITVLGVFLVWSGAEPMIFALSLLVFAITYAAAAVWLLPRTQSPLFWSLLGTLSSFGFYLTAYAHLGGWIERAHLWPFIAPLFWGAAAFALAGLVIMLTKKMLALPWQNEALRQQVLGVLAATATGYIALGLCIEVNAHFLPVALSLEMLALCALYRRLRLDAFKPLIGLMMGGVAITLQPDVINFLTHPFATNNMPLFSFGLPAVLFGAGAYLLRAETSQKLTQALEAASVALLTFTCYAVIHLRTAAATTDFSYDQYYMIDTLHFFEHAVFTLAVWVIGLGCFYLAHKFKRPMLHTAGLALAGFALFRLIALHLLADNPLFGGYILVGNWPLANGLLLAYVPSMVGIVLGLKLAQSVPEKLKTALNAVLLGLVIFFASINLRHLFVGSNLSLSHLPVGHTELYSYSVLWLALGAGLLLAGTLRKDKLLRVASLIVMLLTVGKVFLIDAGELDGLLRVVSFLGLGLSLIALSWFYNRFIFTKDEV